MLAAVDYPSWISAFSSLANVALGAVAIIISIVSLFKAGRSSPDYAIVSCDGLVLRNRGFGAYGLHVKLASVSSDEQRANEMVPEYIVTFAIVPDYFEVSTREGAVVKIQQTEPREYRLRFIAAGLGNPVVQANFKLQAY